jgi:hypothetical protein
VSCTSDHPPSELRRRDARTRPVGLADPHAIQSNLQYLGTQGRHHATHGQPDLCRQRAHGMTTHRSKRRRPEPGRRRGASCHLGSPLDGHAHEDRDHTTPHGGRELSTGVPPSRRAAEGAARTPSCQEPSHTAEKGIRPRRAAQALPDGTCRRRREGGAPEGEASDGLGLGSLVPLRSDTGARGKKFDSFSLIT